MTKIVGKLFCSILCLYIAVIYAVDGLAVLRDIPDNTWIKLPVDGADGPHIAHTNITVDSDKNRIYLYGSDTHGAAHNNSIWYFDLTDFTWHQVYSDDPTSTYVKVTSPVLSSGEWWWATSTGHPVPSHVFDGFKYIPGKDVALLLQSHSHNYYLRDNLDGFGEPVAWLFNTNSLEWSLLKNARAPDVVVYGMMAVTPNGSDILATDNSRTYEFDWVDSTWIQLSTSGAGPNTYHMGMEYDSDDGAFYVMGGSAGYSLRRFDLGTKVWSLVESSGDGPEMNGTNIGYDTLNKAIIAHVADNSSSTYSNPSGNAMTMVRSSASGNWQVMKRTTSGDTCPPHYGFCFRCEYDMANNVTYFFTRQSNYRYVDVWAYRYIDAPATAVSLANDYLMKYDQKIRVLPLGTGFSIQGLIGNQIQSFRVYDVKGRMVYSSHQLPVSPPQRAGSHQQEKSIVWVGVDSYGRKVANGNYVIKVNTLEGQAIPRVNLIR